MGVLSGAVMVAINPIDKMNAANDVKVKTDISGISKAMQTFIINNRGLFPDGNSPTLLSSGGASGNATTVLGGIGGLVAGKELGAIPVPPSGYGTSYTYYWDNSATPPRAKIIGTQKKGSTGVVAWCSWVQGLTTGASYATNLTVCP